MTETSESIRAEMTGGCLCGAVRFTATDVPVKLGVCHCRQCQQWTGAALASLFVPEQNLTFTGDTIATYTSSGWAERGFCSRCGSHLFWRMTDKDNDFGATVDIPLGLFDDPPVGTLAHEIFIDHAILPIADQGQVRLTRADCVAKFPKLEEG